MQLATHANGNILEQIFMVERFFRFLWLAQTNQAAWPELLVHSKRQIMFLQKFCMTSLFFTIYYICLFMQKSKISWKLVYRLYLNSLKNKILSNFGKKGSSTFYWILPSQIGNILTDISIIHRILVMSQRRSISWVDKVSKTKEKQALFCGIFKCK